jgi:hypothetical protein
MLSLTRELTIWRSVDLSKGKLVALSPAEIQTGISIARTVASYTPASVVVCPVLDFTGMALGNYAEAQAEAAQNQWQSSVMTHLTTVQSSVGAIQGSMAVIGLGSVAGVALSAVNLYHMMKLRQDVKQLKLEVKSGFIDLKQALKDQGAEIIQRIDQVAKDVKFQHHQTILVQAYGLFMQAINCLRGAVKLQDVNRRNAQIDLAKGMLFHSLANYGNPQLLEDTCSAGQLRRRECAWAIDQAITMTHQFQGDYEVVSDRLSHLQDKIRQDLLIVMERCETEDELDFLFPEITRIHNHDLVVLDSWKAHVDWTRALSLEDLKLLSRADLSNSEVTVSPDALSEAIPQGIADTTADAVPPEQVLYENLKHKSHYLSLRDQLKFMVKPDSRRGHESYITQQATASGYKALAPSNWQAIPDLTVANLYWYFKNKEAQA